MLTVTEALGTLDVSIALQRGARLSGAITDAATGRPLADVQVFVVDTDGISYNATSDAQGRYSVAGIPCGDYTPAPTKPTPTPITPPMPGKQRVYLPVVHR